MLLYEKEILKGILNIMQNIIELMEKVTNEETIIKAVFSGIRNKSEKTFNKVTIKKVIIKNEEKHQFEYFYDKNVEHKNLSKEETKTEMSQLLETYFKQAVINTVESDYQILISKQGVAKIHTKTATRKFEEPTHNKKKKYILNEGELTPFLIELGIMTAQGKIVNAKYDKFKQINRYLELVSDCIPYLDKSKTIRIIDFGCGKGGFLRKIKETRDSRKVNEILNKLREAAENRSHLFPIVMDAVRAHITMGEIMQTFEEVFGRYKEQPIY